MFNKSSVILPVLILFTMYCWSQKNVSSPNLPAKKVYIQLYSVRDDIHKDFKTTIVAVAKAGYTGVEVAGYSDGKFYGLTPAEFKKEINVAGM